MSDSDRPWEPPLAGTELEHLLGALDRLRATFRWKADDLDAAGLRTRIGASDLTLGGLLKHLAVVEDSTFASRLSGEPLGAPGNAADRDDPHEWAFSSAAEDTPEQLYRFWDGAVERSRTKLDAALARGGLDQLVHVRGPDGRHAGLRRLVCDLIEEYGRHTGHADLLREAVDGLVGEDPPAGWHPGATLAAGSGAPHPDGVDVDRRLRELGIELPPALGPAGNYVPAVRVGNLVFLSGTGPVRADGSLLTGEVGDGGLDLDTAREAARLTGLQILAMLRAELGDLARVRRVVKLLGMVNTAPGFTGMPAVIDGCSDLLVEVLGADVGRGARSAVGVAQLPFDIAVEIEAVVEIGPPPDQAVRA